MKHKKLSEFWKDLIAIHGSLEEAKIQWKKAQKEWKQYLKSIS
jgi:hypothetical protein